MRMTIDKALKRELISEPFVNHETGLLRFRLGMISTTITAWIVKKGKLNYGLIVSHKLKAAGKPLYLPAFRNCKLPGEAVYELVSCFTHDYAKAVNDGHTPTDSWLVKNMYYEYDLNAARKRNPC